MILLNQSRSFPLLVVSLSPEIFVNIVEYIAAQEGLNAVIKADIVVRTVRQVIPNIFFLRPRHLNIEHDDMSS